MKRETQIAATVTDRERRLVREAAARVDLSVSELIRRTTLPEAARILEQEAEHEPA